MADDLPQVGAEAVLIYDAYARDIATAIKLADKFDNRIDNMGGTVDVKVKIDDSDIAPTLLQLENLNDDASVTVGVDNSEIDSTLLQLEDLSDDASVKVDVDDSEVSSTLLELDDLNEDASTKVDVDDSEVTETIGLLQQIRDLAVINIVMDIPQKAIDFLNKIPGLQAIFDQMGAQNVLQAALPQGLENGDQIVSDLFTSGFGGSQEEVARFVAMLSNIGVEEGNIKNVATDLYEAQVAIEAITGTEPDMTTLLARVQDLQSLGLADSFEDATDVIVAGFQSSIGLGGDFLGDLGEFAPTFATMGFTSAQMLATLNTGLAGGVDNISRMSEGLISFNENASQSNPNFVDALKQIDKVSDIDLGAMFKDFQEGDVTGADFMASVLEGARTYAETNGLTAAQGILGNIFGGTASNIGAQSLLAIDPNSTDFSTIEDRAQNAADTVREGWETTLTELQRTVEQNIGDTLDEVFDLTDRLETAKEQFNTFITELKQGKSVGEAIEIAFEIPDFADAVTRFESSVGDFAINVLEVIAGIQEFLGKDSSKTRTEITRLEKGQLAFDLKVANEDEIAGELQTAIDRGLKGSDIAKATGTALEELIAGGDFDKAQALLDSLNELKETGKPMIAPGTFGLAYSEASAALRESNPEIRAQRIQEQLDKGNLIAPVSIDTTEFQEQLDQAIADAQQKMLVFGPNPAKANPLGAMMPNQGKDFSPFLTAIPGADKPGGLFGSITADVDNAIAKITDTKTAVTDLDTTTATATENTANSWSDLNVSMDDSVGQIVTTIDEAAEAAELMDARTATALTQNTVTASFDAVRMSAEANFPPIIDLIHRTAGETEYMDRAAQAASISLAGLTAGVKGFPIAKLEQIAALATTFAGAQNIVNNSQTTNNINVTNNNSNSAQTSNSQYQLAQQLGGG